jgi:hypothetical protein
MLISGPTVSAVYLTGAQTPATHVSGSRLTSSDSFAHFLFSRRTARSKFLPGIVEVPPDNVRTTELKEKVPLVQQFVMKFAAPPSLLGMQPDKSANPATAYGSICHVLPAPGNDKFRLRPMVQASSHTVLMLVKVRIPSTDSSRP